VAGALAQEAAPVGAAAPQDCAWVSFADAENSNVVYPDTSVNYYLARVAVPAGGAVLLRGRYPHARYTAFNAYDEIGRPTDALADTAIRAERGSTNPFIEGHRRDLAMRDYTVRVVAEPKPKNPRRNTVYLGYNGRPSYLGSIIYRVYLPDRGRDQFGGVGLPEVSVRMPDGTEIQQPAACALNTRQPSTGVNETDRASGGPDVPRHTPATDPVTWERFFNVFYTYASRGPEGTTDHVPHDHQGGFYSDKNNAYVSAYTSRDRGRVLVVRGRLPQVPHTYGGERRFGSGDMRYWSMCHGTVVPTGVTETVSCLFDEQLVTTRRQRYTIVMTTPEDRPANARRACGVNWMPWGARPDGSLIMRNQLADPAFDHAVQKVAEPGTARKVMGAYLPRGTYTSTRAFERRGCQRS
jgi:hypothetical protein